jgi:hypothetical protein
MKTWLLILFPANWNINRPDSNEEPPLLIELNYASADHIYKQNESTKDRVHY